MEGEVITIIAEMNGPDHVRRVDVLDSCFEAICLEIFRYLILHKFLYYTAHISPNEDNDECR